MIATRRICIHLTFRLHFAEKLKSFRPNLEIVENDDDFTFKLEDGSIKIDFSFHIGVESAACTLDGTPATILATRTAPNKIHEVLTLGNGFRSTAVYLADTDEIRIVSCLFTAHDRAASHD